MSDGPAKKTDPQSGVDESGRDPLQAMRMSIRDEEEGHQELGSMALTEFRRYPHLIKAGDSLTLYRTAPRDVAAKKPAKLTMQVHAVDHDHYAITFSGRYESANGTKDFNNAQLIVFPDGTVVAPDPDMPEQGSLYVRRSHEPFLLFTDRPITKAPSETTYAQADPAVDD